MFVDANTVSKNKTIKTDVCIVGAGAAGITLAREFIGTNIQVCLLESGGFEYDEDTQALYEGENIGHDYPPLDMWRFRYFGGTTNVWKGFCRPLDEVDFMTRDEIPFSGWPFDRYDLDPFYVRAQPICQLGPFLYDAEAWEDENSPQLPFEGNRVINKIYQFSPPTNFGQVYKDEIKNANNIDTYLYANMVDIETNNTARHVTRLRVACLDGNKFWISAKMFILATGGIENARILLFSNKVQKVGLGNQNDLVGRYFMENITYHSGLFLPSHSVKTWEGLYFKHKVLKEDIPVTIRGALTLSKETVLHEKLLNFSATLEPSWSSGSKGVESLKTLLRNIRNRQIPDNLVEHLRNMITDIDDVATTAYYKLFKKEEPPEYEMLVLHNQTEQSPNPDSRVTLSDDLDSLGKNRVKLNWQLSDIDRHSIRRAHEIIGEELGRAGLGRMKVQLSDTDVLWGGAHHIGTTRMHSDPRKGVVNENCQIHGISNLFIAGSSVFPTSGATNPTLTIVALALRLADHIKRSMI